jgi:hypothetical protein
MSWQPLPPDVAEWMGMDAAGIPDVSSSRSPESEVLLAAPASSGTPTSSLSRRRLRFGRRARSAA